MDEFIDKLADLMNTYPPLWMVYGFVLVLPFVLMACCFIKPKSKDDAARKKKTDEPTPDTNPSGKKEPKKADGATLLGSQTPEKLTAPTSSASPSKTSGAQESGEVRQRSGGKTSHQSGKEKTKAKHTVLITEPPSDPSAGVVEDSEEYTIKEEDIGSVVVVSKAKNSQVSVRDMEEGADEKQIQHAVEEESKPAVATEVAEIAGNSKEETSGSIEPAAVKEEPVQPAATKEEPVRPAAVKEEPVQPAAAKEEPIQPAVVKEEPASGKHPSFPPGLDAFDLIACEADPTVVEEYLADPRLKEVSLTLSGEEQLGLIIVGGVDSPNGSLPIYVKKVVPGGVASEDGRLSEGDQLLAVNDKILLECSNNYAVDVLRKAKGKTRLLVIQDY